MNPRDAESIINRIHMAQVEAGEQVVVEDLRDKGLLPPESDCLNARYPEYGPCSPCGDGDTDLRYHNHEPKKQAIVIPLDELQRLITEYCDLKAGDSTDGLRRLFLKGFMEWMRERG